jgi:hypothetical protein
MEDLKYRKPYIVHHRTGPGLTRRRGSSRLVSSSYDGEIVAYPNSSSQQFILGFFIDK